MKSLSQKTENLKAVFEKRLMDVSMEAIAYYQFGEYSNLEFLDYLKKLAEKMVEEAGLTEQIDQLGGESYVL